MAHPTALVTGASSGIGAATVRRLASEGWRVVAAARRLERLEQLAATVPGVIPVVVDVTDDASVDQMAATVDVCDLVVANAGAAFDIDPVARASSELWTRTFDVNVVGTVRTVRALLPALGAAAAPLIVLMGSTAGRWAYEGGGSYVSAKRGIAALREILRLELVDAGVRICEVAPGMVATEEFTLNRFAGDVERAAKTYEGVEALSAEDVADVIAWVASRPPHVNIDAVHVTPLQQAAVHKVVRAPYRIAQHVHERKS